MENCKFKLGDTVKILKKGFFKDCVGRLIDCCCNENGVFSYVIKFPFEETYVPFDEDDISLILRSYGY